MSVKLPSSVVTVIVAVPCSIPVITPLLSTVTFVSSELLNVTFLFEALSGVIVAVNVVAFFVAFILSI